MNQVFVFDVDGTVTGARKRMAAPMADALCELAGKSPVYLVTGSDWTKLEEQLPQAVLGRVAGVFTCSGNELRLAGRMVYSMAHAFPDELLDFAATLLARAPYRVRTGNHIEERTGTLNISVVGRNASEFQRADYARHDAVAGERDWLIEELSARFPDYEVHRGGKISVDVTPRGWNKARILPELASRHRDAAICFFGDNIRDGGNDMPLAMALEKAEAGHRVHAVGGPAETLALLSRLYLQTREVPRQRSVLA